MTVLPNALEADDGAAGGELLPVFTIGHSTRSIPEFVDLLRVGRVESVIDVRSVPRSRTNPQFNRDALPKELSPFQIDYVHIAELGGLRKRAAEVPQDVNGFWINRSFHNYADYALSPEFHAGFAEMLAMAEERRIALMCAEAVWWRCHRRIIADYLIHAGRTVYHLMGEGDARLAQPTEAAVGVGDDVHYPAAPL